MLGHVKNIVERFSVFLSGFLFLICLQQVVWSGFVDIILDKYANLKLGISVLRCVRLLRVFKVTRWVYIKPSSRCVMRQPKTEKRAIRPGRYSWEFLVGVCRPILQILTLIQTKKGNFPHPFSDLISKIHTPHFTRWNTEKRVKNTTRSGIFLTKFEVFHLVMKYCVECLILLVKQNDFRRNLRIQNWSNFHLITKHS